MTKTDFKSQFLFNVNIYLDLYLKLRPNLKNIPIC